METLPSPDLATITAALEEALEPFARAADAYDAEGYSNSSPVKEWAGLLVGELRAARDALARVKRMGV